MTNFLSKVKDFFASVKNKAAAAFKRKPAESGRKTSRRRGKKQSFFDKVKDFFNKAVQYLKALFGKLTKWLAKFDKKLVYGCGAAIVLVLTAGIILLCSAPAPADDAISAEPGRPKREAFELTATLEEQGEDAPATEEEATDTQTDDDEQGGNDDGGEAAVSEEPVEIYFEKGDSGEVIISVQERLMQLDYMGGDIPTELFGETTSQAVSYFQRKNDLNVTGILDNETYELLMSDNAKY